MHSVKPTGWTGRIEGPVTPAPHQSTTPTPQHPPRDPLEDTHPDGGLYKFDLGTVPASVTPPPTWRRAAWFAVASSAATLGGLMFATAALMGNTTSIQGLDLPSRPRGGDYPPLPEVGNHAPPTGTTGSVTLEPRPPSLPHTEIAAAVPEQAGASDRSGAASSPRPSGSATPSTPTPGDETPPDEPGAGLLPGAPPGEEFPGENLLRGVLPIGDVLALGDTSDSSEPTDVEPTDPGYAAATSGSEGSGGESSGGESSGGESSGGESSAAESPGVAASSENSDNLDPAGSSSTDDDAVRQRTEQYFASVARGDLRDAFALTAGTLRARGYESFASRYARAASIEVLDSSVRDTGTVTTLRIVREDETVTTQRRKLEFTDEEKPRITADTLIPRRSRR
ncbi:hypothetical protein DFQ14_10113 [Halopolyspora algeriensis]|uniref:Uncharacterized protein n=1 Tax=Halopolyspora algeriensis TaxID=1500506 RepID=A0A368VXH1_9ACTN|nr:hypothetical protein [Halopolyspora algeriensis]RCW46677.1 hypothetical protein DFQ14_10113 [Halopolyspora algeriensis]TQM46702.1 hypothetical protein FHU43_3823 [Halopolyspora algeriensis]